MISTTNMEDANAKEVHAKTAFKASVLDMGASPTPPFLKLEINAFPSRAECD